MFLVSEYVRNKYEESRINLMSKYKQCINSWDVYKAGLDPRERYGSKGWKKHRPKSRDFTVLVMWQNQKGEKIYRIMRGDFTITDGGITFYSTLDFTVVSVIGGSKPTSSMRKNIVLPVDCSIYNVSLCYPCITLKLLYKPLGSPCFPIITLASPDDSVEDARASAPTP